ncbi:uncharacterized protein LOC110846533 isoform X2 [Folsomia candida]|uniref:uncharacterized protein LOC110846533 isoform X2 n=1 Tax=Folsomia candida TaxID=158441 RepID=UPI000B900AB7|nr:uncharacterized protein LOC110846533 isoform X2 [Folsomia candida]
MKVTISIFLIFVLSDLTTPTFVKPSTFLDSRLAKGFWVSNKDIEFSHSLFEGGWVWTASGNLQVTHVCRAKSGLFNDVSIVPGELLNETCYVSGNPTVASLSGVRAFKEYEVLLKVEDEVFEWVEFDRDEGTVPHGAIIGGIGTYYEPILVCRKFFNGTAGNVRKSKAVLGKFSPKEGKCFYEMEVNLGAEWIKWDVSFATEKFQLLILRVCF